jgi:hypothetical protein
LKAIFATTLTNRRVVLLENQRAKDLNIGAIFLRFAAQAAGIYSNQDYRYEKNGEKKSAHPYFRHLAAPSRGV